MKSKSKVITRRCDCGCCMFVIEKSQWKDGVIDYDISIMDGYYDHNFNTLWGRIKRAFSALFGEPVYYNDVYMNGEDDFRMLIRDMQDLADTDLSDNPDKK